jgi:hypothetical protein
MIYSEFGLDRVRVVVFNTTFNRFIVNNKYLTQKKRKLEAPRSL